MKINPIDRKTLSEPEYMHAYCSRKLGTAKRIGNQIFYPCPYGNHTRPKLQVREYHGSGYAKCWACGKGGTVFDIAASVEGLNINKEFPAVVYAVADAVNYPLLEDFTTSTGKRHRPAQARLVSSSGVAHRRGQKTPTAMPPVASSKEIQDTAVQAMNRAEDYPEKLREHAELLGIPLEELEFRTHFDSLKCGGIGIDKWGRLLYIYSHKGNVFAIKTRNKAGAEPRFIMRGSPALPWGMDDAENAETVIITEGESDALSIHSSFFSLFEYVTHNAPDRYPKSELHPAVIAKPSAGTFKEEWAHQLIGKDVVLVVDNDDAGRMGASKTAVTLRAAGVRRVFLWLPPDGCKDARAALNAARPWELAESILINKQDYKNEQ